MRPTRETYLRCQLNQFWSVCFAGGSISNLYAFLAARHKMFPGYKEKGLTSIKGQLVMFTSDQVTTGISILRGEGYARGGGIFHRARLPD